VRREFTRPAAGQVSRSPEPRLVDDWRNMLRAAYTVGDPSAPVNIVEFVDMQCPYCARFHQTLSRLRAARGASVSYSFIHLPLPGHPHALAAARSVECARAQGRFLPFLDAVFTKQDSIGRKSWTAFALAAGITDTNTFASCARDTATVGMISAGLALAEERGIRSTPTILLNGWQYHERPRTSNWLVPWTVFCRARIQSRANPNRDRGCRRGRWQSGTQHQRR